MNRLHTLPLVILALACAAVATAGAPIKGVGISLGKVPGGGCAARTTDASGHADFGAWPTLPAGGVYTITIDPVGSDVQVTIHGATEGVISREVRAAAANARAANAPIRLHSDGTTAIVVDVQSRDGSPVRVHPAPHLQVHMPTASGSH
ncbi:MAG: hypothetical protein JSS45_00600 [Proteobacteria bacterium]|nr:hypothetical protein [Pseudomonadota bacterium]